MTFVGKILVVTQVIFSIVFMAFAGAVYQREQTWKTRHDAIQAQLTTKSNDFQAEYSAHEEDKEKHNKALLEANNEKDKAKADFDASNKLLADEKKRHEIALAERTSFQSQAEIAERVARVRREETEKQLEINRKLIKEQDDAITLIAQLRKQIYDLDRIDKDRQGKHDKTLEQLAVANETIKKYSDLIRKYNYDASPEALAERQLPPPTLDGRVQNTRTNTAAGTTFVEISLGSDDGLAVGHVLYVSRGAKYLGQIKLVDVKPDSAVGTVVKSAKQGIIEEGDHVTTKL